MKLWPAFKATYSDSAAFVIACPLLALFPMLFEMIQHLVEVHIGMYDSISAAQRADSNSLRMAIGYVKVLALYIPAYWITRFLPDHDASAAARIDPLAIKLFSRFLAFELLFTALQLFMLSRGGGVSVIIAFIADNLIMSLIAAWGAAAALGNAHIGPISSLSIMSRRVGWTFLFFLATTLPLMIPHYLLAIVAILGPKALLWPVLFADGLLVSWLTVILAVSAFHAGNRAARLAGTTLRDSGRSVTENR